MVYIYKKLSIMKPLEKVKTCSSLQLDYNWVIVLNKSEGEEQLDDLTLWSKPLTLDYRIENNI